MLERKGTGLHVVALFSCAFLLSGCGENPSAPTPAKAPPPAPAAEKSSAQTLVDGFTGRTAVDAGRKARSQIEKINAEREADMNTLGVEKK